MLIPVLAPVELFEPATSCFYNAKLICRQTNSAGIYPQKIYPKMIYFNRKILPVIKFMQKQFKFTKGLNFGKGCCQLTGSSDFTLKSLLPVNWQQRFFDEMAAAS